MRRGEERDGTEPMSGVCQCQHIDVILDGRCAACGKPPCEANEPRLTELEARAILVAFCNFSTEDVGWTDEAILNTWIALAREARERLSQNGTKEGG